jgi:diaminohydroxyphosphoribosylaminopyrimidine deaminase/5-amino-6-(5-phosphoribosylamino)uracil reductase
MRAALALARRGLGTTWPNPSVGCVIVRIEAPGHGSFIVIPGLDPGIPADSVYRAIPGSSPGMTSILTHDDEYPGS